VQKELAIPFPQQKQVTAIRVLPTEGILALGNHLITPTPKSQRQPLKRVKERELTTEEIFHHLHQEIRVGILTQIPVITMMMTMGKRMMTGEGREDDQIAMLEDPRFPEMLPLKHRRF
jgi:hypothetical protein